MKQRLTTRYLVVVVYSPPNHSSDSALVVLVYGASIRATVKMRGADFLAFLNFKRKVYN